MAPSARVSFMFSIMTFANAAADADDDALKRAVEMRDYRRETFSKGSLFTHQRADEFGVLLGDPRKQSTDFRDFRLFWTSPGTSNLYFGERVCLGKYVLTATEELNGIYLLTSPSDILDLLDPPNYLLDEYYDPFVNAWYGILEGGLLGQSTFDFVNCFDDEIIFSTNGLRKLDIVRFEPAAIAP